MRNNTRFVCRHSATLSCSGKGLLAGTPISQLPEVGLPRALAWQACRHQQHNTSRNSKAPLVAAVNACWVDITTAHSATKQINAVCNCDVVTSHSLWMCPWLDAAKLPYIYLQRRRVLAMSFGICRCPVANLEKRAANIWAAVPAACQCHLHRVVVACYAWCPRGWQGHCCPAHRHVGDERRGRHGAPHVFQSNIPTVCTCCCYM
jgi:hypothetical protein